MAPCIWSMGVRLGSSSASCPEVERPGSLGTAFSSLLIATFVTNLGDGLRVAALPLLASTLTSSPLLIGGLTAAQFLPWMTFAPFGGVVVDRSDRRRLILITQTWRALVMAALGVAILTEVVQIWHLFVVAIMVTVGEILVDPSVIATVATLVKLDDLDRANARITTVETATNDFAGGPVGALSFAFAPWLPFLLDSLSYLGSLVPFSRLPSTQARPITDGPRVSVWEDIGDGLRWIGQHPFLRPLTAAIAVYHLGTAGALSLLILLVTDVLEAPGIIFGIVLGSAAVGATIASLFAARLTAAFGRRFVITVAATAAALSGLAGRTNLTHFGP